MPENKKFLVPTSTAHNIPLNKCYRHENFKDLINRQAGTELGQAQLKLGLDFNFCRFGFSGYNL